MDGSSATWEKTSLGRSLPKKVFVVSLNYFLRCVSHNNSMYGRPALRAARCASRTSFRRVMLGPLCVFRETMVFST